MSVRHLAFSLRRCIPLVAVLALTATAGRLHAQTPPTASGLVTGRVIDAVTEQGLGDATIRLVGQTATATTVADGSFTLRGVVPGIVRLEVRRIGYLPLVRSDLAVSAGKPVVVTLAMRRVPAEQLAEVTIRPSAFPALPAAGTPVATTTLTSEELRRTPGALEDVVQALAVTPGIGTTGGGRNDLFVRGGAAYENLFVVDNIEVPNINHFGSQGSTGGPLSLMNVRFIEEATISAGGFGVRYGDRVSSATSLTLREGNRERLAGELNLAASQFGAIVEGPMGRTGSFLLNVRRSYLDLLFKALGVAFVPTYTDLTAKLAWRPSPRDAVSFLTVAAIDQIAFNNDSAESRVSNSQILGTAQDQYFSGLTWKRLLARGVVTTTLGRTWSRNRSVQNDSLEPPSPIFALRSTEGETSLRSDLTLEATPSWTIDAGVILKRAPRLQYDLVLPGFLRTDATGSPQALTVDTTITSTRLGAYVQATRQATPRLRVTGGLRGDTYGPLGDARTLAPRLSAVYQLSAPTSLTLSVGRFYQAPSAIWLVGDAGNAGRLAPLRADQVVAGWRRLIGDDWRVQVEGYAKRYAQYPTRLFRPNAVLQPSGFDDATLDIPFGLESLAATGTGRVWGIEALLQKRLGVIPVYGLVALSYTKTAFTAADGSTTRGAFDTPLIFNVVGGWRPSRVWEVSGRLRTSTGRPFTPYIIAGGAAGQLDFARYNSERLPTFVSVDARVDRRWTIGRTQLVTFIDVGNINARANVNGYRWNPRTRLVEAQSGIAILPTIGINWEF